MQEVVAEASSTLRPQQRRRRARGTQAWVPTREMRSNHKIKWVRGGGGTNQTLEVESGWMDMATGKLIEDYTRPEHSFEDCFEGYTYAP